MFRASFPPTSSPTLISSRMREKKNKNYTFLVTFLVALYDCADLAWPSPSRNMKERCRRSGSSLVPHPPALDPLLLLSPTGSKNNASVRMLVQKYLFHRVIVDFNIQFVMWLRTARKKYAVCLSFCLSLSLTHTHTHTPQTHTNTTTTVSSYTLLHIQHHQIVRIYNIYNNP
jgi:hypothetical protein